MDDFLLDEGISKRANLNEGEWKVIRKAFQDWLQDRIQDSGEEWAHPLVECPSLADQCFKIVTM